jgi:serpin B
VRSQVSAAWLADATNNLTSTAVQLSLPKFKVETQQLDLGTSLGALGMAIAFSSNADFSGISTEPLAIDKVIQKAFVGVDEDGTEAAAATAVTFWEVSAPLNPVPVAFDRPFLFFIQDQTGLVLFTGQVVDPTQ